MISSGERRGAPLRIISIPCAGKVDVLYLLRCFEEGADGVLVMSCFEKACKSLRGNILAKKRVEYTRSLLREVGIEPSCLQMHCFSPADGPRFAKLIEDFEREIEKPETRDRS